MARLTDLAGRSPILAALAAQGIAWLLVVGLLRLWLAQGWAAPPSLAPLAVHGALAALFGHGLGLQRWWLPLQFFLPFALAGARDLDLPAWLYLLAFASLALVYWNAAGERVPLYLSNKETWRALVGRHFRGALKPPFNAEARERAGFPVEAFAARAVKPEA